MAQRTIHYLFGELLSREVKLKDKKRFLLGSILPDAYVDVEYRDLTHFKVKDVDGTYLDFHKFFEEYYEQICSDDLYLGYYMHLIEDAFYRDFFYNQQSRILKTKPDVKQLHNDYHILNSYIVNKFDLKNELCEIEDLYLEKLERIPEFKVVSFLKELEEDFLEDVSGETFYITKNMVDEFVERYLPLAVKELECVKIGKSCMRVNDYMWSI